MVLLLKRDWYYTEVLKTVSNRQATTRKQIFNKFVYRFVWYCCTTFFCCFITQKQNRNKRKWAFEFIKNVGGKLSVGSSWRAGFGVSLPSTSWRELQSCRIQLKNHHQTSCASCDFLRLVNLFKRERWDCWVSRLFPIVASSKHRWGPENVTFWIKIYITLLSCL